MGGSIMNAPADTRSRVILAAKTCVTSSFLSLAWLALSELRGDLAELVDSAWDETVRRRAEELSGAFRQACERQALSDLAGVALALSSLTQLSRTTALPIRSALRVKFRDLLRKADQLLAARTKRYVG